MLLRDHEILRLHLLLSLSLTSYLCRLCVFKQLPTLPRGCTPKDPPLVKTEHFLAKMPDLV